MNEELLNLIIAQLETSQVNPNLVNLFRAKTAEEVPNLITGLATKKLDFKDLIADKDYQKEFDRLINKAVQTREANLKEKYNFIEKEGKEDLDIDEKGGKEVTELMKKLEDLRLLVENQQTALSLEKKRIHAAELLKTASIPDRYIQFFDFNSDKPLEEQFKGINEEFIGFKNEILGQSSAQGFPVPKDMLGSVTDAEIENIINNL